MQIQGISSWQMIDNNTFAVSKDNTNRNDLTTSINFIANERFALISLGANLMRDFYPAFYKTDYSLEDLLDFENKALVNKYGTIIQQSLDLTSPLRSSFTYVINTILNTTNTHPTFHVSFILSAALPLTIGTDRLQYAMTRIVGDLYSRNIFPASFNIQKSPQFAITYKPVDEVD